MSNDKLLSCKGSPGALGLDADCMRLIEAVIARSRCGMFE